MNQFKSLDLLFPCGDNRLSGEVVTTAVRFYRDNTFQHVEIWWKRKACYVNASVNAFHMHRGLCREFSDQKSLISGTPLTSRELSSVKKMLARAVLNSYLVNYQSGSQACAYDIDLGSGPFNAKALWWIVSEGDVRELVL